MWVVRSIRCITHGVSTHRWEGGGKKSVVAWSRDPCEPHKAAMPTSLPAQSDIMRKSVRTSPLAVIYDKWG